MSRTLRRKLLYAATASVGLLGFLSYPAIKTIYPIKRKPTIVDDYVDLPTATADLTKDIILPEGIGTGTDVPIDISHWLLLSLLKSKNPGRRDRVLDELARQRRWTDAECQVIAQALDRQDIIRLARTEDADLRLFLRPPSIAFIERTLQSNKIEKLVKLMLKDLSEKLDSCSSCSNFYTNLSIRVRPDSNILAMSDLNQVDKMMRIESKKRKKSDFNEDVIRLKAVLNNVICGEEQAYMMAQSGILVAILYFRHKYKNNMQISGLISQILANLTLYGKTRPFVFTDGCIQALTEFTRSDHLEVSLPAFKALANLDEDSVKTNGIYDNHIYLLAPLYRQPKSETNFDVIFVHGLVGSVFKSWRQGSIALDGYGNVCDPNNATPTTELLPGSAIDAYGDDSIQGRTNGSNGVCNMKTRCWPKDWLSKDVAGLRILAVDYPTALSGWRTDCDLNKDTLRERAILVMNQLEAAKVGNRPIVWVAHSMGGLLVKQVLALCNETQESSKDSLNYRHNQEASISSPSDVSFRENLLNQTKGVIFYSVPHKGSNLEWIERRNLQKLLMLTTEVIELQKGSPVLLELHERFLDLVKRNDNKIKFLTYFENSISSFGVNKIVQWKGILVHEDSLQFEVGPNYKLNIDHAHTCKPHSKESITYAKTLDLIKELIAKDSKQSNEELLPFISYLL